MATRGRRMDDGNRMLATRRIALPPAARAVLRRAIERDYRQLLARLDVATVSEIEQSFFGERRLLYVESAVPDPAVAAHVMWMPAPAPGGEMRVLTGHLATLNELIADESATIHSDEAVLYAHNADRWTTEYELADMTLSRFDDLPWRKRLTGAQVTRIEALRETYSTAIGPPQTTELLGGWTVEKWVVCDCMLIRRTLQLGDLGQLARTDDIRETKLPVYPGNWWKLIDGKLVPIG
jgi:hypothetical protein